ncbi:hypothetical protein [Frankia sp. CcWB2]
MSGDVPGDAASAAAVRFAALAAVADAVLTAATEPLVIVLEDLHWADTNTVELVRQVAGGIVDSHLLLIATMRAEAGDVMRELSRLDSVHAVPLRPLTAAAVRDYLTALDPAASTAARAEQVARRSGGLPSRCRCDRPPSPGSRPRSPVTGAAPAATSTHIAAQPGEPGRPPSRQSRPWPTTRRPRTCSPR